MSDIKQLIAQAEIGEVQPLADFLRDKPMSPTGFTKTEHGSFGDGHMEDRSWLEVESAVMDGELSRDAYNAVRAAAGR